MNPKNTAYLTEHFPFFGNNFNFECGDGWFELIKNLSEKLHALNVANLSVSQVKEKLGGLHFYIDLDDTHTELRIVVNALIAKFEDASYEICEICGCVGRLYSENFLAQKTRCAKCL